MIYKYRSTGNASDRGRGMFHPLPAGARSHRCTATGGDNPYAVNVNDLTEIPFPLRGTVSGPIAPHCPPPLEGEAGRWGCFHEYRETQETAAEDRGGGDGCLPPGKDAIPELRRNGRETLSPLLRGLIFSVPAA